MFVCLCGYGTPVREVREVIPRLLYAKAKLKSSFRGSE